MKNQKTIDVLVTLVIVTALIQPPVVIMTQEMLERARNYSPQMTLVTAAYGLILYLVARWPQRGKIKASLKKDKLGQRQK